jgi:TolB-like protein
MAEKRRLAAILVADVVGYSRLMEADESGTLAALRERRKSILEPIVREHGGRIVKVMGDGVLVEFGSAVNSVSAALELQERFARANEGLSENRRILLRVGINLGDVIGEGSDIYGDGINIAARLESIAEPGGICISGQVHESVRGKVAVALDDIGLQQLKNIEHPVHTYRVQKGPEVNKVWAKPTLTLPDKPSIAVLPFQNMSGEADQEYFADGVVEEIITALSRFKALFVIARNSSFTYKGRAVDVKQVGKELGVRYVLEGSVRKAGKRLRITGQLIDAGTGAHLWADRFDGTLEDIFELQDQVTARVVGAIAPKLEQAENERAGRKPTDSLDAYDYFLRGMSAFYKWTKEANSVALASFYKAFELDPNYAAAYAMAARSYSQRRSSNWEANRTYEVAETARLARRAEELGKDDAVALCSAGASLVFVVGDFETGGAWIERALALNPNLAWAWLSSALLKAFSGESETAIEYANQAMRLSPHDAQVFVMHFLIGLAHFYAGRYSEAVSWAEKAMREQPDHIPATVLTAVSGALAGDNAAVVNARARLHLLAPDLRISNLGSRVPIRRSDQSDRWAQGMRLAGLPE